MRWNQLKDEQCSVARTMAVIGDRWTLLILRNSFFRVRRFEDFLSRMGIARRVLTERLTLLVENGILEKISYQDAPVRYEYRLTDKGLDLYPVLLSMVHWGDKHYAEDRGKPILYQHKTCGHDFVPVLNCSECGEPLDPKEVRPRKGPGLDDPSRIFFEDKFA